MLSDEWNGDVYCGGKIPSGFRLLIKPGDEADHPNAIAARAALNDRLMAPTSPLEPVMVPGSRIPRRLSLRGSSSAHLCGGDLLGITHKLTCPNCQNPLFPVFQFDCSDERIASLGIWDKPYLHFLVCPFCFLYMTPYWIVYLEQGLEITGGLRDGGKICNQIRLPYDRRHVSLRELTFEDYPLNESNAELLDEHRREPGIYHQIGGLPPIGGFDELDCCRCNRRMEFVGAIDYDNENVPLFEYGDSPVALIIGDMDILNAFTCTKCGVVGIKLAQS